MVYETPTAEQLAILVLSSGEDDDADTNRPDINFVRIFDMLHQLLAVRLGSRGCHALLNYALTLAAKDCPWLASISIGEDAVLDGFQGLSRSQTYDGGLAILVKIIGLLDTFVGRNLTIRMLHNAWPDVIPMDDMGNWSGADNG
jgi:hypothetical protein